MNKLRKSAAILVAAIVFVLMLGTPAAIAASSHRIADTTEEVAPIVVEDQTVVFSHTGWALITIVLLPILIGLVRKESVSRRWKFIIAAVITIATAIVERAQLLPDGTAVVSIDMVVDAVGLFIGSWLALQKYDDLGNGKTSLARLLPDKGIG